MMTIRPSHRRIQQRLADLALSTEPVGYPTNPSEVDANFVSRLQSLAVASSITPSRRSTRLRRQLGAVVGAVGIIGWAGAAAAGASVGLAATGNLPAPVQDVVADVLDVVNISIPRPDPSPEQPTPVSDSAPLIDDETSSSRPSESADEGVVTQTTVPGTSTTTTIADNPDEVFAGEVIACSTPAAANNPNCFERVDDETVAVVPVSPACDTPAAARNPNCQNDGEDEDSTDNGSGNSSGNNGNGNSNGAFPACDTPAAANNPNCEGSEEDGDNIRTIPACDTPAATNNPNCFEDVDDDIIIVVPSCEGPAASRNPKCEVSDEESVGDNEAPGNSGNSNSNSSGNNGNNNSSNNSNGNTSGTSNSNTHDDDSPGNSGNSNSNSSGNNGNSNNASNNKR